MELQGYAPQSIVRRKPKNGLQNQKRGRHPKGKPPQHSDEIVFYRGTSVNSIPSISKKLKGLTAHVIGLQYLWEYRSPSQSVPPHYHCKLCSVAKLQDEMLDHIKGWKHSFRYMKKAHPEMVSFEEAEVLKDPTLKKTVKDIAAEVERTRGRGQLKVIFKEPYDVPAFHGHRSATPRPGPSLPSPLPPTGQRAHFGAQSPRGGYRMDGFGGYPTLQGPPEYSMDQGPFHIDISHNPVTPDGYGHGEIDTYGASQRPSDYSNEFRETLEDRPMERQMRASLGQQSEGSNGGDLSNTLLSYLDTFKIENESDAQLVLKVTEKLTDVLMEYRLRSISGGPGSMPTGFSLSTLPRSNEQFSGYPGPSRYSNDWNYK